MQRALEHIAAPLRTFIVPQIEQLEVDVRPQRFGIAGAPAAAMGQGALWAASIDDDCLVSSHRLVLECDLSLVEYPGDYGCICSASIATLECTPLAQLDRAVPEENLLTFVQPAGKMESALAAGRAYDSLNLCFTPSFFARLRRRYPGDFDTFVDDLAAVGTNELPAELRLAMRGIDPRRAALPGAELFFRAKALEAASLVAAHVAETKQARAASGVASQRALVAEARLLVEEHLGEPLGIDVIARQLYVGRTRLSAAFREEMGMGLGAYVRRRRIERAQDLLDRTSWEVAQVARAVGYPRASTFSEAFARETGMSPTAWRRRTR